MRRQWGSSRRNWEPFLYPTVGHSLLPGGGRLPFRGPGFHPRRQTWYNPNPRHNRPVGLQCRLPNSTTGKRVRRDPHLRPGSVFPQRDDRHSPATRTWRSGANCAHPRRPPPLRRGGVGRAAVILLLCRSTCNSMPCNAAHAATFCLLLTALGCGESSYSQPQDPLKTAADDDTPPPPLPVSETWDVLMMSGRAGRLSMDPRLERHRGRPPGRAYRIVRRTSTCSASARPPSRRKSASWSWSRRTDTCSASRIPPRWAPSR